MSGAQSASGDLLMDWMILVLAIIVYFDLRNERKPGTKSNHCRTPTSATNLDAPFFHVKAVRYVPFLDGRPELEIPVLNGPMDAETRMQVIDALEGALQEIERQNIRLFAVEKELKVLKERQAWREEEAEWEDYDEDEEWDEEYDHDQESDSEREEYVDKSEDEYADDEDDVSEEEDEIKTSIITFNEKPFYRVPRVEIKELATTRVTSVTSAYVYCN